MKIPRHKMHRQKFLPSQPHIEGILVDHRLRINPETDRLIMGPNISDGKVYKVEWFDQDQQSPKGLGGVPIIMPQKVTRVNPIKGGLDTVTEDLPKRLPKNQGGKPFIIEVPYRNPKNPQEMIGLWIRVSEPLIREYPIA